MPGNEVVDGVAKKAVEYDPEVSESVSHCPDEVCHLHDDEGRGVRRPGNHQLRQPFKLGVQAAKEVHMIHDLLGDQLGHHADASSQDRPVRVFPRHRVAFACGLPSA